MNPRDTQIAIKELKDFFERELAKNLNLVRVSAPLFVTPESGFNDNLSGKEKAVDFSMRRYDQPVEIVQSLAKWKRMALKWYEFNMYEGIYADMNAIRPDEELDEIHSIYVDQWDWEKIIKKEDRNTEYLKYIVCEIFKTFRGAEEHLNRLYPNTFRKKLPEEITFITTEELLQKYPDSTPKERENLAAKEYGAIFLTEIGGKLSDGYSHDTRSPDYDDWELNGDIIFWNETLNSGIELSSMGIRVDENALLKQLELADAMDRKGLKYHRNLIEGNLPYTVGGGIGQSRICMFFLEKRHIGEVQASVWTKEIESTCSEKGVFLL